MANSPTAPELDDDRPLGVPTRANVVATPKLSMLVEAAPGEPELRPGETELGRPTSIARDLAPLSDAERILLQETDDRRAAQELAEAEQLLASDPEVFRWAGILAHPLAAAILIGGAGVLGLFLYSQFFQVMNSLANVQPAWLQNLGYGGLGLLAMAVLYAMLRLLVLYYQLRRNQQIRIAGLHELASRTRLRWLAHAKSREAKDRLHEYMTAYPMQTEKHKRKLERLGFAPEQLSTLTTAREQLLDPSRFASTGQWFGDFRTNFQGQLDAAAAARVAYWSKRAGITGAVAPNGLIDSLAMSYFGFAMITDLCQIYNLRAGRAGTAVLLGRVFFNAYLSGQMTEWEKLTEDQLNLMIAPGGPLYEIGAARVMSKFGTKAAGGVLTYFLLARLGKYACGLLRPVA